MEILSYNYVLSKKNSGFFPSSNFVQFEEVRRESKIAHDGSLNSDNARLFRLEELIKNGNLDVETCKGILADHYDYARKKVNPGKNSVCSHREIEPNLDVFDKRGSYYRSVQLMGK